MYILRTLRSYFRRGLSDSDQHAVRCNGVGVGLLVSGCLHVLYRWLGVENECKEKKKLSEGQIHMSYVWGRVE